MKTLAQISVFLFFANLLPGQSLTGASSRWSDSFVEWEIFGNWATPETDSTATDPAETDENEPEEERLGAMKLRWLDVRNDWTEWDFEIGEDLKGTIKQKWKNDPTNWELRTYDGSIVHMRATWANDLSEWKITDNSVSVTFRSRWTNRLDEWLLKDQTYGRFYLYTMRERDPRDWAIEDDSSADISLPMKLAMIFITVFHSSPRQ